MQGTRLLNIYHSLYVHWLGFKAALYRHKHADVTELHHQHLTQAHVPPYQVLHHPPSHQKVLETSGSLGQAARSLLR